MKEFFKVTFIIFTAMFFIFWMPSQGEKSVNLEGSPWMAFSDSSGNPVNFVDIHGNSHVLSSNGEIHKYNEESNKWEKAGQANGVTTANSFTFVNSDSGYIAGDDGYIGMTTDGGATWTQQSVPYSDDLIAIDFSDTQTGYAVGDMGIIYKTTNGGATWTYKHGLPSNPQFNNVIATDSSGVFLTGGNGTLAHSTDGGEHWSSIQTNSDLCLFDLSMPDNKNGTAIGSGGTVLVTSDSGSSWNSIDIGTNNHLTSVVIDPQNYQTQYIAGDSGFIARTNDAGVTWEREFVPTDQQINRLEYDDEGFVWAVGDSGTIVTNSPNYRAPNPPQSVITVQIYSDSAAIGLLPDTSGSVIASGKKEGEDEYSQWATLPGNLTEYTVTGLEEGTRYWFYFQGERNGLLSEPSNTVSFRSRLKTPTLNEPFYTDSAAIFQWENHSSKADEIEIDRFDSGYVYDANMYKLEFSEQTDYNFTLLATIDASETSYTDNDIVPGNLFFYRIRVLNDSTDSEYSNIVSISIDPTGIEEESSLPEEYALSQNYPNPFNPSTHIKYAIPSSVNNADVSLKIYDMLGNEIETLVNKNQQPGFYELKWEAANNASGIYFYVLEVKGNQGFRDVKKMILLK